MGKSNLSMILPTVGKRLNMLMSNSAHQKYKVEPCIVTYVNNKHSYYEVMFLNTGLKESYKLPIFDHNILNGLYNGCVPVICVENGIAYSSVSECAKDTGVPSNIISAQINGSYKYESSYHFINAI